MRIIKLGLLAWALSFVLCANFVSEVGANSRLPLVLVDTSPSITNDLPAVKKKFLEIAEFVKQEGGLEYFIWDSRPGIIQEWDGEAALNFTSYGNSTGGHRALANIAKQYHFCSGVVVLLDDDGLDNESDYKLELENLLANNVTVYALVVSFKTRSQLASSANAGYEKGVVDALNQEAKWLQFHQDLIKHPRYHVGLMADMNLADVLIKVREETISCAF